MIPIAIRVEDVPEPTAIKLTNRQAEIELVAHWEQALDAQHLEPATLLSAANKLMIAGGVLLVPACVIAGLKLYIMLLPVLFVVGLLVALASAFYAIFFTGAGEYHSETLKDGTKQTIKLTAAFFVFAFVMALWTGIKTPLLEIPGVLSSVNEYVRVEQRVPAP
jgi:hypothetical protein